MGEPGEKSFNNIDEIVDFSLWENKPLWKKRREFEKELLKAAMQSGIVYICKEGKCSPVHKYVHKIIE